MKSHPKNYFSVFFCSPVQFIVCRSFSYHFYSPHIQVLRPAFLPNRSTGLYTLCALLHIMDGTIIVFRLPHKTKNTNLSKFCQKFYGQNTSSHGGKYRYRRYGLLDDIPYRKLLRCVIIVRIEDVERIIMFLKGYSAEIHTRPIELTKADCEKMDLTPGLSTSHEIRNQTSKL